MTKVVETLRCGRQWTLYPTQTQTVLSLTWDSPYLRKTVFILYWDRVQSASNHSIDQVNRNIVVLATKGVRLLQGTTSNIQWHKHMFYSYNTLTFTCWVTSRPVSTRLTFTSRGARQLKPGVAYEWGHVTNTCRPDSRHSTIAWSWGCWALCLWNENFQLWSHVTL